MNKIKYILLLSGFLVFTTSCEGWLDLLPEDDLVSEEFWKSQQDVESVLSSSYGVLTSQVKTLLIWGELRGGLLSEGDNVRADGSRILRGDITDVNAYTNWSGMYRLINSANQIIKFAPPVVERDPSFSKEELDQILSEALFLRALSYFYLVRTFNEVPLVTEPYVSDEQNYYPAKSSEQELMASVISDLELALNGAETDFGSVEKNKGRVTEYAIHALLADAYLWMDDYNKAIQHCDFIINSGKYALLSEDNWFQNFYPGNSNSSIFEIQFLRRWGALSGIYETFSYRKNKEYTVNPRITEIFVPGDVRGLNATYKITNMEVWKHIGLNADDERGDLLNDNNFIVYRLADIMLLKAEALIQLQQFDEALDIINYLSERRGTGEILAEPVLNTMEDILLDERARELLGEGKYWFDLIRIGKRDNYRRKDKVISSLILNAAADAIPALSVKFQDPNSWYMPIRKDELQINQNLVQNPYYQK